MPCPAAALLRLARILALGHINCFHNSPKVWVSRYLACKQSSTLSPVHIAKTAGSTCNGCRWSSSRPPAGKQLNLFNQGGDRLLAQATAPQGTSGTGSDFSEFTMTISQEPKLLGTAIISAIVCLRAFDEHSQRAVEKKRQLCSILCCLGFGLIGCLVAQCLPYEHSYEDEKCSLQVT